ncbi:tetratricopeptide repeat protein [Roseovarius sp. Pro17]|uniref:tetratricopeptide repeat protein n=1 Tax=Roseovarius sp. Pro17 TaxID=3108175 RepID=UPI002D784257|nr:tetratricopeptide repeat protein [Roseovarius sp. Pro17]
MLAYLACQPGFRAERALLADLLWSDRSEKQARASLRQELSTLRRLLPEGLLSADRQAVWLGSDLLACERGDGDFLQGFDLPSEGFEDWLRTERARTDVPSKSDPTSAAHDRTEQPALAVMPFDELGVKQGDMFAEGVVEEITGALSRIQAFHVIARQSVFALPKFTISAPDAALALGVDYLLEGSVRRTRDRVRISIQLVDGKSGHALWSGRFDDRIDDLFDLQDRIAAQVAGQILPNLRSAEIARARRHLPEARSAYELMLTAFPHFWVHDSLENERAVTLLDAAVEKAPDFGPALAQRAWCHSHRCCYLWTLQPEAARQLARADFDSALQLVDDHAPALTALSATAALALKDFRLSEELALRALDIDPNNAWGWLRLGWVTCYLGRPHAALEHFDRAEALSPLDPFLFNIEFGRSACLRALKDYDGSIARIEKGLRAAPRAQWAYRMLFGTLWLKGDKKGAITAGKRWLAAHPGLSKQVLLDGIPSWNHDPDYLDVLTRFDEIIADG